MISEKSCNIEDWINGFFKILISNCNNISQYYIFLCIFFNQKHKDKLKVLNNEIMSHSHCPTQLDIFSKKIDASDFLNRDQSNLTMPSAMY